MSLTICYLCGQPIDASQVRTGDHVVPIALVGKRKPKIRGYAYGGRLPTHQACNNHFSDETFFKHALHLVTLIRLGQLNPIFQSNEHEVVSFLPLTTNQVPTFRPRDFGRFGLIDTRRVTYEEMINPRFFEDKKKTNLLQVSLFAAMTVFAKSAAALLVRNYWRSIPSNWRIDCAMFDATDSSVFGNLFPNVKPFGISTRAHIEQASRNEWLVRYQHQNLLAVFLFMLHDCESSLASNLPTSGADMHRFEGASLNELLTTNWRPVPSP